MIYFFGGRTGKGEEKRPAIGFGVLRMGGERSRDWISSSLFIPRGRTVVLTNFRDLI